MFAILLKNDENSYLIIKIVKSSYGLGTYVLDTINKLINYTYLMVKLIVW